MNPYQYQPHQTGQQNSPHPGQPQPYLYNIGFNNRAPQSFGMPTPYGPSGQGFPTPGYPQAGYNQPSSGYPQAGYHQPSPGYPQSTPGFSQSTPGYPQSTPGYSPVTPDYEGYPPVPRRDSQAPHGYPQPNASYPGQNLRQETYQSMYRPSHQGAVQQPRKPRPAVVPANPFNPRADAEALRKAMKGFGTDEKSIIQIITKRSNEQRLRIAYEFKTLYGKDLIDNLKSELSGNFETLIVALMTPLPQYYAKLLHDAMEGIGTDEDVLIEVLCTMSNHEIQIIKQAYESIYARSLEDDLASDTSGNFKRLMVSLCCGNRNEDHNVNLEAAQEDAKALLRAGELRFGTDESEFNRILTSRSFQHLAAVFQEYKNITGHDLDDAIKNEFSGDIEKGLLAIVKVVRNKCDFFAERLYKSMKGLGTSDDQLIRVMVTRSEVDLGDINDAFLAKYGESLQSWIEGDTSGHYKKCFLGLLGLY